MKFNVYLLPLFAMAWLVSAITIYFLTMMFLISPLLFVLALPFGCMAAAFWHSFYEELTKK